MEVRAEDLSAQACRPVAISVIVPAYRSAATLPKLAERLTHTLSSLVDHHEVIFVCDGSPDETWAVIEELAARYPCLRGIHLQRNFGQHNALLCGVRSARGELIALMDDDLQDRPEELPKLIERLNDGFDVVVGVAKKGRTHSPFRLVTSWLIHFSMRLALGGGYPSGGTSLRVFRTRLRDAFADYSSPFANMSVLLSWATTRWATVEVQHDARQAGSSTYSVRALVAHAIDLVTSYSVRPLRVATFVGFFFTCFGFAIFLYVLISYWAHGGLLPGFAFLASAISILAGAQLCSLGIVGEYIARIYLRSMGKPAYFIREATQVSEVVGPSGRGQSSAPVDSVCEVSE